MTQMKTICDTWVDHFRGRSMSNKLPLKWSPKKGSVGPHHGGGCNADDGVVGICRGE